MLAELAAANAAFAVIKGALANGKELHQLGSRVFDYFDNKAKIQESATKKGGGSDLAEFMALEQLRQQEEDLRERMVYAGRPGMWGATTTAKTPAKSKTCSVKSLTSWKTRQTSDY